MELHFPKKIIGQTHTILGFKMQKISSYGYNNKI